MGMKPTFAVIGERGQNAAAWAYALSEKDACEVRVLVRDAEHFTRINGYVPRRFELDDPSTFAEALEGLDFLGLVTPPHPKQVERELALIEAARAAGVGRIINLSVLGADMPSPISAFARWQGEVERALVSSGVSWITLRPASFTDNLLRQKLAIIGGTYIEPLGDRRYVSIDIRTIADCVVALTKSPEEFDWQTFELTGTQALSGEEIAGALGKIFERDVKFVSPPIPQYREALTKRGLPDWQIASLVEMYEALQAGGAPHLARVTDDVERLTGKPARPFLEAAGWILTI